MWPSPSLVRQYRLRSAALIGFAAVLAIGSAAHEATAAPSPDDGTRPAITAHRLPAVRWVVIERNAGKAAAAPAAADCSRFVLTQARVAGLIRRARQISEWDYHHTIDWLPCFAGGRLGFVDGRSAHWSVGEGGGISLRFDDGAAVHLYCADCRLPNTGSWRHQY